MYSQLIKFLSTCDSRVSRENYNHVGTYPTTTEAGDNDELAWSTPSRLAAGRRIEKAGRGPRQQHCQHFSLRRRRRRRLPFLLPRGHIGHEFATPLYLFLSSCPKSINSFTPVLSFQLLAPIAPIRFTVYRLRKLRLRSLLTLLLQYAEC